jgi:hypothetical protein
LSRPGFRAYPLQERRGEHATLSRLFISHSARNNPEAIALRDWLAEQGFDDVFLDIDPDRGLAPGERWQEALKAAADRCEAVLFLVPAGRLFEIARVLSAPITYFYEGVGQKGPPQITPRERMLLEITSNFAEIRNEKHQEAISHLARVLSSR